MPLVNAENWEGKGEGGIDMLRVSWLGHRAVSCDSALFPWSKPIGSGQGM